MGFQFNLDEVLEVAERIEVNGGAFYRQAAQQIPDEQANKLFQELAAMEDEHVRVFRSLRAALVQPDWLDARQLEDEQTAAYLQAMADTAIFEAEVPVAEKLKGISSVDDALVLALRAERDSIAFYVGLQKLTLPHQGRQQVDAIIQEECKHVVTLNEVRKQLRRA